MSKTDTQVVTTTAALSRAIGEIVKEAGGQITKSRALNTLAREIAGPKHNWGYLTTPKTKVKQPAFSDDDVLSIRYRTIMGAKKIVGLVEKLYPEFEHVNPQKKLDASQVIALSDGAIFTKRRDAPDHIVSRLNEYFENKGITPYNYTVESISRAKIQLGDLEAFAEEVRKTARETYSMFWAANFETDEKAKYAFRLHNDAAPIIDQAVNIFLKRTVGFLRDRPGIIKGIKEQLMDDAREDISQSIFLTITEAEKVMTGKMREFGLHILQTHPETLNINEWEDKSAEGVLDAINKKIPTAFVSILREELVWEGTLAINFDPYRNILTHPDRPISANETCYDVMRSMLRYICQKHMTGSNRQG